MDCNSSLINGGAFSESSTPGGTGRGDEKSSYFRPVANTAFPRDPLGIFGDSMSQMSSEPLLPGNLQNLFRSPQPLSLAEPGPSSFVFRMPGVPSVSVPSDFLQDSVAPEPLFPAMGFLDMSVSSSSEWQTPIQSCSIPSPRSLASSPAAGGGQVTPVRALRLVTPRSSTTGGSRSGNIEPLDRSTLMAIVEGRGQAKGEIGIACMSINSPTLTLSQFSDTQSYKKVISKINVFRPYEILMPVTSCDPTNPGVLYTEIQKEVRNVRIMPIQRRIFNEAHGLQRIRTLVADQYAPVVRILTNKYYCLSASHALIKYAELVHSMVFANKTLKIDFRGPEETCMIDHVTAKHLELLQNNQNPNSSHSLFGIMNACKTPHGSRLLRMNILQPSTNLKVINARQGCVEEFIKEREVMYGVQDILGRLSMDFEHVLATFLQIPKGDNTKITEQRINYMIALKTTLELVPSLVTILENSEHEYLITLRDDLIAPQIESMLERIKSVIHDEAKIEKGVVSMKRQRCFAVKAEVNPILDIARKAYCEIIDDVNSYVKALSRELNIPLRLGCSGLRGFYVQFIMKASLDEVPELKQRFLQVRKKGNVVTFTSDTLVASDRRAKEVMDEIEHLSGLVISELINYIRNDIYYLFKVSEALGDLDLLYALANYSLSTPRCVRPSFSKDVTAIVMGRHPILDAILQDPSVPNNVFLSGDVNLSILTGPNMSGKTTYIKQVALLQVVAQIGSFVPADAATFRIANNILSRLGTYDCVEECSSSFTVEMQEMLFILQNLCDTSLVIIDELGRSTSVEEGAAISFAICEQFVTSKAFVLFATHHLLLTKLESMYLKAMNFKMDTEEWTNAELTAYDMSDVPCKLRYTHQMTRGVTNIESYGLKLALKTPMLPSVIQTAIQIAQPIIAERKGEKFTLETKEMKIKRLKYLLASQLLLMAKSTETTEVDPEVLKMYFKGLQDEFKSALQQINSTEVATT